MQIKLLDLPCTIFSCKFRQKRRIVGLLGTVLHNVCTELMRAMTVFSIDVMRDYYVRLMLAQKFCNKLTRRALFPLSIGIFELSGIRIIELSDNRIAAHTHGPKAIKKFAAPSGVGVRHIGDYYIHAPFRVVGRNRAAKEDQFIIRMSR